jgi:N-methylhydantoinase A
MRIAIDTGGTFTDCVYFSEGRLNVTKFPSTPEQPSEAVLNAVAQIAHGKQVEVRHGTTVGTNALLQRKGARVAFVTTAGFEDTIAIGRQARPKLYDLFVTKEAPLIPEHLRFGVHERTAFDGSILRPVDPAELESLRAAIQAERTESIAVSLLFSFANPANERAIVSALRDLEIPISASHEILPEFREYERGSTVVINAYLAPLIQRYLEHLDNGLHAPGSRLQVMQSSGGIVPASIAAREPVRTIVSGPAGGVIGGLAVARAAGFSRIITFDMGGTSTDVSLVNSDRGVRASSDFRIMDMPVAVPMLDIHTVGAGGGSIATFDAGGALKVGPQSAGADPGPICYGRGVQPTVTDANLLLGRLDPDCFLGGGMKLNERASRHYFEELRRSLPAGEMFAEGIIRVADLHMEKALRKISVEQGHDPRDFVLVSFGGAGPLHACALARALRIRKVLIPAFPGALSAYGILVSDVVRDYSRTVMLQPGDPSLLKHFEALEELGARDMESEGLTGNAVRSLDLRYAGQGYELSLDWSADFVPRFHRLHEQHYGYSDPQRRVEIVNARVRTIAPTQQFESERMHPREGDGSQAILKRKPIYYETRQLQATVYDRSRLKPGDRFHGPGIVVEYSSTTFLPPGSSAYADEYSNLLIDC